MSEKTLKLFKSLMYSDMAINYMMTRDCFNNEWRDSLTSEEKQYWIDFASRLANTETK